MYEVFVPKSRELENHVLKVTRDKLNILMETFYKEVEKLRDQMIQVGSSINYLSHLQYVGGIL